MRYFQRHRFFSVRVLILVIVPLLLCQAIGLPGIAQEKKQHSVKKIGVTLYRLGEIEFDAKTREIFLPVVVNQNKGGPMEYILVHENGKVHESILTTKVRPLELQIVLKLLKYQSGNGDVFNHFLPENQQKNKAGKLEDRGDLLKVAILLSGKGKKQAVSSLILDGKTSLPMEKGGWVYTGSEIDEGNYMAELEGSIIAVYLDSLSMFNTTCEGSDDDERWGANKEVIPEIGTRGTLVLSLSKETSE